MSRFSDAVAKAKSAAVTTGKGFKGLVSDAYRYATEPVPRNPPKIKKTGKIPRWQRVAENFAGTVDHNIAEGTGRKPNRRDNRDFDFGISGADNLGIGSTDPWGLGIGNSKPKTRQKKKRQSGGRNITIIVRK